MEKFGQTVLDSIDSHMRQSRPITYRLDWRYTNAIYLKNWINEQMTDIGGEIKMVAKSIKGSDNDEKILNVLHWVFSNIDYKSDKERWKTTEKWQTPYETYSLKTGDCEDGAILLFTLARLAGISANQIRIVCGDVRGGGHCWVEYISDSNGQTYYIDWCYWPDFKEITTRPIREELKNYYKTWWGFNDKAYFKGYKNS